MSNHEAPEETPPAQKRARYLSSAAKYDSKFNAGWQLDYPFASPRHVDKLYSSYSSVCMKDVSCRHQGVADLKRHEKSVSHTSKVQAVQSSSRWRGWDLSQSVVHSIHRYINSLWMPITLSELKWKWLLLLPITVAVMDHCEGLRRLLTAGCEYNILFLVLTNLQIELGPIYTK